MAKSTGIDISGLTYLELGDLAASIKDRRLELREELSQKRAAIKAAQAELGPMRAPRGSRQAASSDETPKKKKKRKKTAE